MESLTILDMRCTFGFTVLRLQIATLRILPFLLLDCGDTVPVSVSHYATVELYLLRLGDEGPVSVRCQATVSGRVGRRAMLLGGNYLPAL
jgi:hypothetical protein